MKKLNRDIEVVDAQIKEEMDRGIVLGIQTNVDKIKSDILESLFNREEQNVLQDTKQSEK